MVKQLSYLYIQMAARNFHVEYAPNMIAWSGFILSSKKSIGLSAIFRETGNTVFNNKKLKQACNCKRSTCCQSAYQRYPDCSQKRRNSCDFTFQKSKYKQANQCCYNRYF